MISVENGLEHVTDAALRDWLQGQLNRQRYQHSLRVQERASDLALRFRLTPEELSAVKVASLLHDTAKLYSPQELLSACERYQIDLTQEDHQNPSVLHALVGAEVVRDQLNIYNEDVLNAIRFHTTGRPGMSVIEKIVYIADKIEGNVKNPLYLQKINTLLTSPSLQTLDKVLLYILNSTLVYLIEQEQFIHPRSVAARNEVQMRLKQQQGLSPGVG